MKTKSIVFLIAIFSITFFATNALAFYKGYWKSENNKIVCINDESIMFDNKTGKIIRTIIDNNSVIIMAISDDKLKKMPADRLEKIKTADFQTLSTYGPTIVIKNIDDTKVEMQMPFSPKRIFHKITLEEANKLLPPKK